MTITHGTKEITLDELISPEFKQTVPIIVLDCPAFTGFPEGFEQMAWIWVQDCPNYKGLNCFTC